MLIEMAGDVNSEVAFTAARQVTFYCGVNQSAKKGAFVDSRIQVPEFLAFARDQPLLPVNIERVCAASHKHFRDQFHLLLNLLRTANQASDVDSGSGVT